MEPEPQEGRSRRVLEQAGRGSWLGREAELGFKCVDLETTVSHRERVSIPEDVSQVQERGPGQGHHGNRLLFSLRSNVRNSQPGNPSSKLTSFKFMLKPLLDGSKLLATGPLFLELLCLTSGAEAWLPHSHLPAQHPNGLKTTNPHTPHGPRKAGFRGTRRLEAAHKRFVGFFFNF